MKITIERLDRGWLLTTEKDGLIKREAFEIPANLFMGIGTALSGQATRISPDDREIITVAISANFK